MIDEKTNMSLEDKFEDIYQRKAQDFLWLRVQLQEFVTDEISYGALDFNIETLTNFVVMQLDRDFSVDDMMKLGLDVGLQLVEDYLDFCQEAVKRMKRIVYKTQEGEFAKLMSNNPEYERDRPEDALANPKYIPFDGFKVAAFTEEQQASFYNKYFRGWEKRL